MKGVIILPYSFKSVFRTDILCHFKYLQPNVLYRNNKKVRSGNKKWMIEEKEEKGGTTATTGYLCISSPICAPLISILKSVNTSVIKRYNVYLSNTV